MANVVISSNDKLCLDTKNEFLKRGCIEGIENISELRDNDLFIIIAHDNELNSGDDLIDALSGEDFPMDAQFQVVLIVCNAHDKGKGILSPAENIANFFNRNVIASTNVVEIVNINGSIDFTGNFVTVKPYSDFVSRFSQMRL